MRISHDAADPVGYRFSYGSSHAAVCTDLGTYNDYTVECLKGMDVLLLEANHDVICCRWGAIPIISSSGYSETAGTFRMKIRADC